MTRITDAIALPSAVFSPAMDLKLFGSLGDGLGLQQIAANMGITHDQCHDRLRQIQRPIGMLHAANYAELMAALKRRVAQ